MKIRIFFASTASALLMLGVSALAQDVGRHDDGMGGTSGNGIPGPMNGISSYDENPFWTAKRLMDHEKYADAIPYLDAAVLKKPGDTKLLVMEGLAHTKTGEYYSALNYLKKAVTDDSDDEAAHQRLGELYLAMHNINAANDELAALGKLCSDCDEKAALTQEVADYQAKQASATQSGKPAQ